MPKYVAFLRAINVGGHTVKMESLRRLFEAHDCSKVETFIASGNVIFESASKSPEMLERRIEKFLHQALGYSVATFIRSPAELAAIAAYQPFADAARNAEGHPLYIAFLADTPSDAASQKLLSFTTEIDDFHVQGREVYWLCRKKSSKSEFSGARLEKALGMPATLRNSTTVRTIAVQHA